MAETIKRVLIANRGEIAVRIIRCLRDMGLESVAIYSEADADSYHRKLADYAMPLSGRSSSETYLDIAKILQAAKASGVQAIHPGYGFLSESALFAKAVTEAGFIFVGPSAEAMELMGNKIAAKILMRQNDVPTVPGSEGALQSVNDLMQLIDQVGFPLILKAAAGGGGRGMRIIESKAEAADAFAACQREALSYFGNGDVFAERYIANPRHIEIQILCDGERGVHLFERDCSVQRRHQKLIEEAPSHYLNDEQRRHLGDIALRAALAVGYQGAGTVEFICEAPGKAYFMEMNTRIQVEHPVTEMITGVDLISEQLRIAQGLGLSLQQEEIKIHGWAIEARINAESPEQGFSPGPGLITRLQLPAGPGVRVDTHIYEGYRVPSEYDSMIAKLIVHGKDRQQAIERLIRALHEFEVEGVPTTAVFHRALADHPDFRAANFTTHFLAEKGEEVLASLQPKSADELLRVSSLLWQNTPQASETYSELRDTRKNWTLQGRLESQNHFS